MAVMDGEKDRRTGRLMVGAAGGVAAGIAASVLDAPALGAPLTVGSLIALIYAVHAYGRSGPDRHDRRRRRRSPRTSG